MSYSDTTLDRRRLQPMSSSSRHDLSSSKDFHRAPGGGGTSRFRVSRNILSDAAIDRSSSGPQRRRLPPPVARQHTVQRLNNRFSSSSYPLSPSNSRPSSIGGVMAAAASTSSTEPPIHFCPPGASWQKAKAKLLGLTVQQSHWFTETPTRKRTFPPDTPPKTCEVVAGDGNCLFRSFSFWITGSENFHAAVRDLIVEEIHSNARLYSAVTSNHSITNYLRESQMSEEGVWGSEVEIFVAATLLQTPVAVYAAFGDRHLWQVFRPLQYTEPRERCMLYLQNSNNHFEPVIDV